MDVLESNSGTMAMAAQDEEGPDALSRRAVEAARQGIGGQPWQRRSLTAFSALLMAGGALGAAAFPGELWAVFGSTLGSIGTLVFGFSISRNAGIDTALVSHELARARDQENRVHQLAIREAEGQRGGETQARETEGDVIARRLLKLAIQGRGEVLSFFNDPYNGVYSRKVYAPLRHFSFALEESAPDISLEAEQNLLELKKAVYRIAQHVLAFNRGKLESADLLQEAQADADKATKRLLRITRPPDGRPESSHALHTTPP